MQAIKLQDLIAVMDCELDFELRCDGNKIGTFEKDDIGYDEYNICEVEQVSIKNGKLQIFINF